VDLLNGRNAGPARLRELMARPGLVVAPGCYDALSARLVEEAGFDACYMTGFGTASGYLGRPDVGLLTMNEMVDNGRRIVGAIGLPLIADGDTGYGNAINVVRTVHEYERAGISAIQLEDQVMPKKCGHMAGKAVVSAAEATKKIAAAVAARYNDDFVIIARTDSRATDGLDAAIERARMFRDAGADVLFIEALLNEAEIERVAETFRGIPLFFNWAEGGKTPPLTQAQIADMGFKILIFPIGMLFTATKAMRTLLASIKEHGTPVHAAEHMSGFDEFLDFIGLPEIRSIEEQFRD
jgi:2,3-dimethylmalate lyase